MRLDRISVQVFGVVRAAARSVSLGPTLLRARQAWRFGFEIEAHTFLAKRRHLKAAATLKPISGGEGTVDCFMLLNEPRVWEGIWSLYSFRFYFGPCRLIVLNDGTLKPSSIATLKKIFPGISIPAFEANNREIDVHLKGASLVRCRDWRREFVLFRKLVDPVYLAQSDKIVVLDSDVLHFQPPEEVQSWSRRPDEFRYIADPNINSHCAPAEELTNVCGAPLPKYFNAGYVCFPRSMIDLARVERNLAAQCFERQRLSGRFNHFAEQTLYAMEAAVGCARILPPAYATCPDPDTDFVVMGHFCGGDYRRTWLYTKGLPFLSLGIASVGVP